MKRENQNLLPIMQFVDEAGLDPNRVFYWRQNSKTYLPTPTVGRSYLRSDLVVWAKKLLNDSRIGMTKQDRMNIYRWISIQQTKRNEK